MIKIADVRYSKLNFILATLTSAVAQFVSSTAHAQLATQLWQFATTDSILASPAIGADGTIYVGSYDRQLHAVTPAGSKKWSFTLPTSGFTGIFSSPAIGSNGVIYFGAEDGRLYALNPTNGTTNWIYLAEGADDNNVNNRTAIYSDPAVGPDGTIYFGSYSAKSSYRFLYAITNGVLRWRYAPADSIYSDPVIALDGTIYFGCDDGKLYALNTNGTLRWAFNTGIKAITASPSIGKDGKIYIGVGSVTNPRFYSVNTNGTTNWVFTATNRIKSSAALGDDGTVYFGSDDNHLYALNTNGTLKWSALTGGTNGSSPAIAADGTIYMGCDDGKLYAFDRNGTNLWTFATGTNVYSSPAIASDGTVYVGSSDGKLYAISGSSGLGRTPWPMFRHDVRHTGKPIVVTNTLPMISPINDQTIHFNATLGPLAFMVFDAETPPGNLIVSGSSSNTVLLPNPQIQFSGTGSNRFLTIAPATYQLGRTEITLTVIDAAGTSNSASFVLSVSNNAPVASNDDYSAGVGVTLNVSSAAGVLVNDTDVDGDALSAILAGSPTHGTLSLSNTGSFTYTPSLNYTGLDTFTYRATDGSLTSGVATVTITVTPVNDAPVAVNDFYTVNEDTTLSIASHGVLANDSNVDGDPLTSLLVSNVSHGTLILSNNGAFTYTPSLNYSGQDTFTYHATDGSLTSSVATVTLTINPVNDAPVLATSADQMIDEESTLTITNFAFDVDQPPEDLTFFLVSAPTNSSIDPVTGVFTWRPNEAQGPSTNVISVAVSDDGIPALSATQSFIVVVREVNRAPMLAVLGDQTIDELSTMIITNTATDADLPANVLTFTLLAAPTNAIISTNGIITWTPSEAQGPGTHVFTTRVTDDGTPPMSATNTFTVIVAEVNTAPNVVLHPPGPFTISQDSLLEISAGASDTDLPANTLSFGLLNAPTGMTLSAGNTLNDRVISWTPNEAQGPGIYSVTLQVYDDGTPRLTNSVVFTITVNEVNTAPVLLVSDQTIYAGSSLSYDAHATDSDVPTNALVFALVSGPQDLTVSSAGHIAWPTSADSAGSSNAVRVSVTDDGTPSLSTTGSFNVIVVSRPFLLPPIISGTNVTLNWNSISAATYRVEFKPDLNATNWEQLIGDVTASGATATKDDFVTASNRLYRVRILP